MVAKQRLAAQDSEADGRPDVRGMQEVLARMFDRRPQDLDRLIHERIRLGIVSALAVNDSLSFNDLKKLLKTTDGNLSVHARRLEDAHYVTCTKAFDGRVPKTVYRLTAAGRRALERLAKVEED